MVQSLTYIIINDKKEFKMTTIHSSLYWHPHELEATPYQQEIRVGRLEAKKLGWDVKFLEGWQIAKKKESSEKINLFGNIAENVLAQVADIARSTIKSAPIAKKEMPFVVNPNTILEEAIAKMGVGSLCEGKLKNLASDVFSMLRTYVMDRRGSGKYVYLLDNQNVVPNQFMFNYSMKNAEIDNWFKNMQLDASNYICQKINDKSLEVFSFNNEDKQFLGSDAEKINPAIMSCFAYTLLKAREENAKSLITSLSQADLKVMDLINWGYRDVLNPDENDLVLYMNENQQINHIGRFTAQGFVESKWGINGQVFEHPIFDVPAHYGTKVIFMRKSSAVIVGP